MTSEEVLQRQLAQEREAREQAEAILEEKSRALFQANQELEAARAELESRVEERTRDLSAAVGLLSQEVGERKRAESALRMSEARFRSMADAAPVLVWLAGVDAGGRFFNRARLAFTGRTPEQEQGQGWLEAVHAEDRGRCRQAYLDGFASRRPFRLEYRLRGPDGSYRWVADQATPLFLEDGTFEGFLGTGLDETERRRAEEEGRTRQALVDAVGRAQAMFIASGDPGPVFERLLSDVLALTGSRYGFIGEVVWEGEGRPRLKMHASTDMSWDGAGRDWLARRSGQENGFGNLDTLYGAVLTSGAVVVSNDPAQDPRRGGTSEGHPPLEAFLGLPFHHRDRLVGVVGIANRPGGYDLGVVELLRPLLATCANIAQAYRNEQARQEAEQALRDSEARSRAVLSTAADGIITISERGEVESFNEAAERIFGYKAEEVLGRNVSLLMNPGDAARHDDYLARYLATREARVMGRSREVQGRRRDGTLVPLNLSISEIALGGRRVFTGIVRDVTAARQAEEALRKAKRAAEAASRAKSEFLANMSHEVRTPMTAILGYTDQMLAPEQTEEERVRALQAIKRNGEHLLQILNNVLDLSKIEAGKMDLEEVEFSPWQVVEEVQSALGVRAHEKGLLLRAEPVGRLPRRVRTDVTRVRQVLMNLVSNAIKFTPRGRVVLRLRGEGGAGAAGGLEFEVEDEGIGMTREQVGRLFQAFHQGDSSTTRQYGGTGLGLRVSRLLAEALGGDILVRSEYGRGSLFTFRLPLEAGGAGEWVDGADPRWERGESAGEAAAQPQLARCRGRVLLAEDNRDNQRVLGLMLRRAGLDVAVAENGREAVELALGGEFLAVLMDMQMPELDGYGAASLLRQRGYGRPIIALTAHAMQGDREKCLRAGCTDYLTKPVNRGQLLETLAKHLPLTEAGADLGARGMPAGGAGEVGMAAGSVRSRYEADAPLMALVRSYTGRLPEQIEAMRAANRGGDWPALGRLAHRMRGAAAMHGYPELGETAGLLDDAIREGQESELFAELVEQLAGGVEAIRRGLSGQQ